MKRPPSNISVLLSHSWCFWCDIKIFILAYMYCLLKLIMFVLNSVFQILSVTIGVILWMLLREKSCKHFKKLALVLERRNKRKWQKLTNWQKRQWQTMWVNVWPWFTSQKSEKKGKVVRKKVNQLLIKW